MENKLIEIIAEALEIDNSVAENNLKLDPEDNWDSIALLSVIASIDEEFNPKIPNPSSFFLTSLNLKFVKKSSVRRLT